MVKFDNGDKHPHPESLRGKVFLKLQEDILTGHYVEGRPLKENDISKELGVSRTPVREALRQLELEGLVESIPNRGVLVKGISQQDICDIYAIRILIEGLASRWAAQKITKEELDELRESVELEEFYTLKNDSVHLMQIDTRFHDIIFRASKSKPLMHMLSSFHHFVKKARNVSFSVPQRANEVLSEHRAIFEAISKRDADEAEKLTTKHIKNASRNLIKANNDVL